MLYPVGTLWRQGWNEIPEVMLSTAMGLAGVGISCYAIYRTYVLEGGDYRKYRMGYVGKKSNIDLHKFLCKYYSSIST